MRVAQQGAARCSCRLPERNAQALRLTFQIRISYDNQDYYTGPRQVWRLNRVYFRIAMATIGNSFQ